MQCREHQASDAQADDEGGRLSSHRSLPQARTLPRGGRLWGRILPHRSAAADSCRPSQPNLYSLPGNPSTWGHASRAAELARNRSRLLNTRGQVAADRSPTDRRGIAAAALPRKSFSSNTQLLRASFIFSVHPGASRLCPASTCGGEKGAPELYPVLTW